MTDFYELKNATEQLAGAFEQFKETNDQRLASLERKGSVDVLTDDKLGRVNAEVGKLQDLVSGLKLAMSRPALGLGPIPDTQSLAHKQAFIKYVSKGYENDLGTLEQKAMSVIGDAEGGYLVPGDMAEQILKRQYDTTPMRTIANVMTVSSDALEILREQSDVEASWVGETETRADTEQAALARIRIAVHELHAQPKATQKLLDDAALNVEDWVIGTVADRFARRENAAFISGNGVGQPRGIASYSTAATADASRAWGTFEHVVTGTNGAFAASNPADVLISLMYKLKSGFLPGAVWMMPRAVADDIRKFKESTTNAYLWQPGLAAGAPATLLGFPVVLAEDMPTKATGSLSVAFGNFKAGYTIADRAGLSVLRDPYTAAPYVKFRCTKRVGGDVTDFDAIKFVKFST